MKNTLPTFQKLWTAMHEQEGASARELARRTGISGGQVRYILWRFERAGWAVEKSDGWVKIPDKSPTSDA